ncbi:MAG: leucyl/phenylalanyl-tRNA--protein transferase [Ideonella sp. MAG2]|nr:MAG: leucyl/phenylalanyl-tRNA--protein transferase [Ideonella sp. MAG2]
MPLTWLEPHSPFPPTHQALGAESEAPGLLAVGADLSVQRLLDAYRQGIYPWYSEGQPILWWTPEPRMVLPVAEFKLHRSLRKTLLKFLRAQGCEIRVNTAFERVIQACATTPRDGQAGTWILPDMVQAYVSLHQHGVAHSVETWVDGELVGGLYGLCIGHMFFGESMFAHRTDASKMALAGLVALCRQRDIPLIDCQQNTAHLSTMGARPIPRAEFEAHLSTHVGVPLAQPWAYDPYCWTALGL